MHVSALTLWSVLKHNIFMLRKGGSRERVENNNRLPSSLCKEWSLIKWGFWNVTLVCTGLLWSAALTAHILGHCPYQQTVSTVAIILSLSTNAWLVGKLTVRARVNEVLFDATQSIIMSIILVTVQEPLRIYTDHTMTAKFWRDNGPVFSGS